MTVKIREHLAVSLHWLGFSVIFAGPFFNFILAFVLALFVIGFSGADPAVAGEISADSGAYEAGLREGDRIVKLDGSRIYNFREISLFNYLHKDKADVEVTYERDGKQKTVTVTRKKTEAGTYAFGISMTEDTKEGIIGTLKYSILEVRYQIKSTFLSLKYLITGRFKLNDLSGPVGIVNMIGNTYEQSIVYGIKTVVLSLLNFAIMLSANLGVMNLLPLPALDGGRLVFIILEMIRRKKVSPEKEGMVHFAGLVLLMALMVIVMANDITGPMALPILKQMSDTVFDKDKVVFVPDHFTPNKDIKSAENSKAIREFSKAQGLKWYFEQGKSGVEHAILPEAGVVTAGECIIGADSHTCTYGALGAFSTGMGTTDVATGMATGEIWFKVPSAIKFVLTGKPSKYVSGKDIIIHIIGQIGVDGALYKSMEFTGDGIACLSMDDRFTMANMAIEAGAKNGIFPVDEKTKAYLAEHCKKEYTVYEADEDAVYDEVIEIDLSKVRPTVAFPHLPGNAKTIDEVEAMEPIKIDQVVIGSCTNGRMEDLRKAAAILKGHTVHPDVRVMVIPATQKIYKECIKEGLLDIFVDAGCAVNTPSCGPCMGGHMGVMAAGEKCVSTTNRNFVGRMGHVDSLIYLASPEVAAASAIAGCIANPEKVGEK